MANSEIHYVDVEKTVTVKEKRVTLTLTDSEAKTLAAILSRVGGTPACPMYPTKNASPRKHADSIIEALRSAAYDYYHTTENDLITGHLSFDDYADE